LLKSTYLKLCKREIKGEGEEGTRIEATEKERKSERGGGEAETPHNL
jgi:hypothetical protein